MVECIVSCWVVEEYRDVNTQAIRKLEVVGNVELVLSVEAELACLGCRSVAEVATSLAWVRTLEVELVRVVVQECVETVVNPFTCSILNEAVGDVEEFVVSTESH